MEGTKPSKASPQFTSALEMMTAMHTSTVKTCNHIPMSDKLTHEIDSTHQCGDQDLKQPDRLPIQRIPHRKENKHVSASEEDARIQREPREEQTQSNRRAEQLSEVGRDDGDLRQYIERVQHKPAP